MLNRFLGIDNCIGCDKLVKLPDQLRCREHGKPITVNYHSIPLKLDCCKMPFKYDSKAVRKKVDKVVI